MNYSVIDLEAISYMAEQKKKSSLPSSVVLPPSLLPEEVPDRAGTRPQVPPGP